MSDIFSGPLEESIEVNDGETVIIREEVIAPSGEPAVDIVGEDTILAVASSGSISAPDSGNTAVQATGEDAFIINRGSIAGAFNGISSSGDDLRLINTGTISSDSRAVDLTDGDGLRVVNAGNIIGTGNQRNGTLYVDGTVDDLRLFNTRRGVIDAGEGNLGDAVSVQVGAEGDSTSEDINIVNFGLLQGRGDGPGVFADGARLAANGSSGLRFFNGSDFDEATVTGSIFNAGTITSEVTVGFLGGVVVEDGVAFDGRIFNSRSGEIFGPQNGLYIGNAEHDLDIINRGLISSGSRAVNLDGDNVTLTNSGTILGTENQRNGTVYIDGTGDDITINNLGGSVIDAGEGFDGSGISIQVGASDDTPDLVNENINISNNGLIQGRGTESVPAGVRLFVGSGLDEATFNGSITNGDEGIIASETDAGILIEEGVIFDGTITNDGLISGGNGNAIDASGALGSVNVINNGELDGDVLLGQGDDTFTQNAPLVAAISDLEDGGEAGEGDEDFEDFEDFEDGGEAGEDFEDDEAGDAPVLRIDGGDGIDTIDLSGQAAGIVIDLDLNTPQPGPASQDGAILDAPGGNVVAEVDDVENVIGTNFDDLILGNNELNVLQGGLGNDTIHSFAGADTLDGGEGIDTALFTAGPGVTVDLDDDGNAISSVGDTLISIENINGSAAGDDDLSGNSSSNVLNGQGGNDTLNGEGGADTLLGGAGNDILVGGSGSDFLTGGLGADTFDFTGNLGLDVDTVTDFSFAEDALDVSAFFSDAGLALGAVSQVGDNAVIALGNGSSAELLNVDVDDLSASNFIVASTAVL